MGKEFPDPNADSRVKPHNGGGTAFAYPLRGHTLVELAVALAVVSVLVGIGWGVMQDRVTTYRMFSIARMLHSDLVTLRALAIDTNRETRVHFTEADLVMDVEDAQHGAWDLQVGNRASGSTQWDTLPIDEEGVVDVSEGERSLEEGGANEARWISLGTWGTLEDDSIVFTPRGWCGNPATDYVEGMIALKVVNKRAMLEGHEESVSIEVSRAGMVRMQAVSQ